MDFILQVLLDVTLWKPKPHSPGVLPLEKAGSPSPCGQMCMNPIFSELFMKPYKLQEVVGEDLTILRIVDWQKEIMHMWSQDFHADEQASRCQRRLAGGLAYHLVPSHILAPFWWLHILSRICALALSICHIKGCYNLARHICLRTQNTFTPMKNPTGSH